jgi:LPS O-antigen subunit length determinant protein (WzzB/FepE family)
MKDDLTAAKTSSVNTNEIYSLRKQLQNLQKESKEKIEQLEKALSAAKNTR